MPGHSREAFRRPPKMPGSQGVSYFAGATFAKVGHRCVRQTVELAALRVTFDFLIKARRVELLEPGAEALQFAPGQVGNGFFEVVDGHKIILSQLPVSVSAARHA